MYWCGSQNCGGCGHVQIGDKIFIKHVFFFCFLDTAYNAAEDIWDLLQWYKWAQYVCFVQVIHCGKAQFIALHSFSTHRSMQTA